MNLFSRFFKRAEEGSSYAAKNRLQLVLVHDRINLSPGRMEQLKDELIQVVSRYVEIDSNGIDIELTGDNQQSQLTAHVPLLGARQR